VATGQPVVVEVTLEDELLQRRQLQRIAVSVADAADPDQPEVGRLVLTPAGDKRSGTAEDDAFRRYTAIWRPMQRGNLALRVVEPALADLNLVQRLEVRHPDDEMLKLATDHAALAELAEQTGGTVVPPDALASLTERVPNRMRKTPADIVEPLWNAPLALIVVVLLLTVEWVGRKIIRLA
jgi:hypothetical protein